MPAELAKRALGGMSEVVDIVKENHGDQMTVNLVYSL